MHNIQKTGKRNALLAAIPATIVLLLFFSVLGLFLISSFKAPETNAFTLDNYTRYLGSANERSVLWQTLWLSVELTLASLIIGYPMAYVIVRSQSAIYRNFLIFALVVTFLSGTVTRAYAWLIILGGNGLINTILLKLGVIEIPLRLIYNEIGVFVSLLHFVLPFFVLTMMASLKNIPNELEQAAINLGGTRWYAFLKVTLPLSIPGVVAASSLAFAVALSSFLFPLVLGGGRVRLAANAIYEHIFTRFDYSLAAAAAAVFLVLSLFFVWIFGFLQRILQKNYATSI